MGIRAVLARLRPAASRPAPVRTPGAFAVMHSADIDVHIDGVVRRPTACPPWPAPSRSRLEQALHRQPSVMAQVMLDLHPAFTGAGAPSPAVVDRAEALALEWSGFGPVEAAQWLSAHPSISAQQAQVLAESGWSPRDPRLVVPDRVIDLGATSSSRAQRAAG